MTNEKRSVRGSKGLALGIAAASIGLSGLAPSTSFAGNISIGEIIHAGSGCKLDTVRTTLRKGRFTMVFKEYRAHAGDKRKIDRKNCSVAIPIQVEPGYRIVLSDPAMAVEAHLPESTNASLNVEPFFTGTLGAPLDTDLEGSDVQPSRDLLWRPRPEAIRSECGKDVLVRLNSSILAETQSGEAADVNVSSLGARIDVERCE